MEGICERAGTAGNQILVLRSEKVGIGISKAWQITSLLRLIKDQESGGRRGNRYFNGGITGSLFVLVGFFSLFV